MQTRTSILPLNPVRQALGVFTGAATSVAMLYLLGFPRDTLHGLFVGALLATVVYLVVAFLAKTWARRK